MSVAQKYYKNFKIAVEKRITKNCAVPLSGGLDSSLIVKAVCELGREEDCLFLCYGDDKYAKIVEDKYGINVHYFSHRIDSFEDYLYEIVRIWEEPFYWVSVGYFLYREINKKQKRVSISGLGSDELYGGYSYYDTEEYPRGLFAEISAKTNQDKLHHDKNLLIFHHLRKNDKMGLKFDIEGRYPFLDRDLQEYNKESFGKKIIKELLLEDFSKDFVFRDKSGFIMEWVDHDIIDKHVEALRAKGFAVEPKSKRQKMFFCQFNIWLDIFKVPHDSIAFNGEVFWKK